MHPDARQHFLDDDGLGDVVDASCLEAAHNVLGLRQAGHENDRRVGKLRIALEAPAGLKAVDAWHDGVEKDDVRRHLLGDADRRRAVESDEDGHLGGVQGVGENPQRIRGIVDDENDLRTLDASDHGSALPPTPT